MDINNKPELVCPAADLSGLKTAVNAGADSVYFGIKGINMRANAGNFDILQLPGIMDYLHERGRKGFLALNVIAMETEMEKIRKILKAAADSKVDSIILWDMGIFEIAKSMGLNVHLSTQASVSNTSALKHYEQLGFKRAVLARECTLEQIRGITEKIREQNLNIEIEAFVHGAMCVSVSGRCFMSLDAFSMSANRGECFQPCRREFLIKDKDRDSEFILGEDYVLSPKDLCTISFVDKLIEAGIHSFKIEGRMRSKEYVLQVVSAYREAIDAYFENKYDAKLRGKLFTKVNGVYNRGFSDGFYFGRPVDWISRKLEHDMEKIFVGEIVKFYKKIGVAEFIVRSNKLTKGDPVLICGKKTPAGITDVERIEQEHCEVQSASKGDKAAMKVPFEVRRGDKIFIWRKKS